MRNIILLAIVLSTLLAITVTLKTVAVELQHVREDLDEIRGRKCVQIIVSGRPGEPPANQQKTPRPDGTVL
jgi:methanogenic corrinoid protein MtbC1